METKDGLIIKLTGGNYYVKTNDGIYKCRARGKFRNDNVSPLVGDKVSIELLDNREGYILDVYERFNELYRPKVANVDYGLIVTSVTEPRFNSYLLDKLIVLLELNNITPILLFTKIDLLAESTEFDKHLAYYQEIGYATYTNDSEELIKQLSDKTTILVGQTGVGKSTFINRLDASLDLATGEISKALGRGRHTTRHVEIFYIDEIRIIDSPGFSSMEFLDEITPIDIANSFVEFRELAIDCKFNTCIHINEPKCAVKDNLNNDYINNRYQNYLKMVDELSDTKR